MTRNKKWYLNILKNMTAERAYSYISENLKRPVFIYEAQNAHAAYKELFGSDFLSPQERRALSDKEEIERLKAELELAKITQKKADEVIEVKTEVDQVEDEAASEVASGVLTKEQYKAANPELKGLPLHHAWLRYAKEHGIEK